MKVLIFFALVTLAYAKNIDQDLPISAFGYNKKYAIPLGDKIRAYEEANLQSRIVGGSTSSLGQFPYQAGVLTNFIGASGTGVCGGALISPNRVIHAAHCWFDGLYQGSQSTVVLGTVSLFFGGTRLNTNNVVMHPQWDPVLIRNDVAVIYLPTSVTFSDTIAPIGLPSGSQLNEVFAGETAIASGYGITSDGGSISTFQVLSHVQLNTITNPACAQYFPWNVVASNICTSGVGGTSTCSGDSGGPLAVTRNQQPLLVGITSFGSSWGCEIGWPAAFARITSFIDFFNQHL